MNQDPQDLEHVTYSATASVVDTNPALPSGVTVTKIVIVKIVSFRQNPDMGDPIGSSTPSEGGFGTTAATLDGTLNDVAPMIGREPGAAIQLTVEAEDSDGHKAQAKKEFYFPGN